MRKNLEWREALLVGFWEGALDRILRKALGWILEGLKIYDDLRLDLRFEV